MTSTTPYNDVIMDHIKNARNYRVIKDADRHAEKTNPLCGDRISLDITTAGDRVADIGFQCECCGISMASASVMTESVLGCSVADARAIVEAIVAIFEGRASLVNRAFKPAPLCFIQAAQNLQSRVLCATLPWITLKAALDDSPRRLIEN